jgi:hypothetical protein
MLTKRLCYDGDKDDRLQERIKQQEELRKAAGLPEPEYHWKEPDPAKDIWGRPLKPKRQRRQRAST